MIQVRPAIAADLPDLVDMAVRFWSESVYKDHFAISRDQCLLTLRWLLANGAVFVAQSVDTIVGMIGVAVTPNVMSGALTCGEIFWWVNPDSRSCGLRLLREAETWGKGMGAVQMTLVAPDPRAERLYERLKFRRVESAWQRSI